MRHGRLSLKRSSEPILFSRFVVIPMPVESVPDPEPLDDQDGVVLELHDRCARPRCRNEFKRSAVRGRRQQYCTEMCRGIAEKEYKQAKATVAHYQRLLKDARYDLAAFGRSGDDV